MRVEYEASSLVGSYAFAISGEGGHAPFGALGILDFDGRGGVAGSLIENRLGDQGCRRLIDVSYRGSYSVTAQGIGSIAPQGDGQSDMRFVVQRSQASAGKPVVTEISFVFRGEDPSTGCLKTGFAIRRPDGCVFDRRSLRGKYAGLAVARGGPDSISGVGVNVYDGDSGFQEANVASVPATDGSHRTFAEGTDHGVFSMNANGIGSVANGGVLNIITRAVASDGIGLAEEYWFMMKNVSPTGAHFTGVMRRISD